MKYLCVCDGGNVRSHALAYVLHDLKGHEAIAVGRIRVSAETMDMLCGWADRVVLMQPHMMESIPESHRRKVLVTDVGVDRFGIYIHPELLAMVNAGADWLEAK
jgi:hypothetical protein